MPHTGEYMHSADLLHGKYSFLIINTPHEIPQHVLQGFHRWISFQLYKTANSVLNSMQNHHLNILTYSKFCQIESTILLVYVIRTSHIVKWIESSLLHEHASNFPFIFTVKLDFHGKNTQILVRKVVKYLVLLRSWKHFENLIRRILHNGKTWILPKATYLFIGDFHEKTLFEFFFWIFFLSLNRNK